MEEFQSDKDVYKEKYHNKTIVVKFGGALASSQTVWNIARQIDYLKTHIGAKVVVVHGGGTQIDVELKAQGLKVEKDKASGLRITDASTLSVSDRMLKALNGNIVDIFNQASGGKWKACGLSGYDQKILEAVPVSAHGNYTGKMTGMKMEPMREFLEQRGMVPVLTSVCFNTSSGLKEESRLNVNADDVAAHIFTHMKAERLIVCSDIDGVLDKQGNLISQIFADKVESLIEEGTVVGGMIPKLRMLAHAVQEMENNGAVALVNGFKENAILNELLYDQGCGTLLLRR